MEYSTITFEENDGKHYWHIAAGNYQSRGYSNSLESAELDAYKVLNTIPNHGTVHCIYKNGKKIKHINAND